MATAITPTPSARALPQLDVSWLQPRRAGMLRLLSYNIQVGITTRRYRHYVTQSWKHVLPHPERMQNLDAIARLVRHFDIVGLQESDAGSLRTGFVNQIEYLANRGHFPYWLQQTNRRIGQIAHHSKGLLSRIRPDRAEEFQLPGLIPGRGGVLLQYGTGEQPLVVVLLHLALGRRSRERQLGYVADLVQGYRHIVLMGDFNCRLSSREARQLLARSGLREPAEDLATWPSWRPYRNIDHILVSPSLEVERVETLSYTLSDHLPIAMEVKLPEGLRHFT